MTLAELPTEVLQQILHCCDVETLCNSRTEGTGGSLNIRTIFFFHLIYVGKKFPLPALTVSLRAVSRRWRELVLELQAVQHSRNSLALILIRSDPTKNPYRFLKVTFGL